MKRLALAMLFPAAVMANDCVLQDRTVTQGSVTITERSGLRSEVVPLPNGMKRCQVTFRARVGADWHTAFGEYDLYCTKREKQSSRVSQIGGSE